MAATSSVVLWAILDFAWVKASGGASTAGAAQLLGSPVLYERSLVLLPTASTVAFLCLWLFLSIRPIGRHRNPAAGVRHSLLSGSLYVLGSCVALVACSRWSGFLLARMMEDTQWAPGSALLSYSAYMLLCIVLGFPVWNHAKENLQGIASVPSITRLQRGFLLGLSGLTIGAVVPVGRAKLTGIDFVVDQLTLEALRVGGVEEVRVLGRFYILSRLFFLLSLAYILLRIGLPVVAENGSASRARAWVLIMDPITLIVAALGLASSVGIAFHLWGPDVFLATGTDLFTPLVAASTSAVLLGIAIRNWASRIDVPR